MSTMKALLAPVIVAVLVLLGLSSWQDTGFREQIEGTLTASSEEALADAGLGAVDVGFTGRDATVEAETAADAATAGAVVRDVTGVRVVRAVGPDGEVDLDSVAAGPVDGVDDDSADGADDGGADDGDGGADDGDGDPVGSETDGSEDTTGDDSEGSDSDDSEDGSEDGSDGSDVGDDGDSDADGSAPDGSEDGSGDSDDSDREPTKKEKAEAQDDLVEIPNITFVTDSAELTRDGKRVVRRAAEVLEEHPDVRVRIEGHTDSRGNEDDNLELSKRRAITVLDRLVDLGVDEDRLSYKGYGESDPLVAPRTFADLEKNRRVEFVVLD